MKPIRTDNTTLVLGKPSDMTDRECSSLPVQQHLVSGFNAYTSCWELSEEEIREICLRRRLYITVIGGGHPPLCPSVTEPS